MIGLMQKRDDVMEKSSYLERFKKELQFMPYQSRKEADREELQAFLVLFQLMEQRKAGAVSLEFASRDWMLTLFHLKGRADNSPEKAKSSFSRIVRCLLLNGLERTVLIFAVCVKEQKIIPEQLSRIRGEQRKTIASLQAAKCLHQFLQELEGREEEDIFRPERAVLFLESGWRNEESGIETPLMLRRSIQMFFAGEFNRESLSLPFPFCRRKKTAHNLPPIMIYSEIFQQIRQMCSQNEEDWTLCLCGEEGSGKEFLALHLAKVLGKNLLVLDGKKAEAIKNHVSGKIEGIDVWSSTWIAELAAFCLLSEDLLYLRCTQKEEMYWLRTYIPGLIVVGMEGRGSMEEREEKGISHIQGKYICVELLRPSAKQKEKLWEAFLAEYPHSNTLNPASLGSKYVLNAGGIRSVLYAAWKQAKGKEREEILEEDIIWAVHQSQSGGLGSYAAELPCVFSWEDLIVEEQVKTQLSYICGQVKYRSIVGNQWGFFEKMPYGKGLCALFYGPPGTGKTMAVQVLAKELGLDVYRIDLSRMVSKYIGETQKHISALFEQASQMNVILFFDEADSFFSKRSEIKDSNDRNANGEVSHLLQKLEEYEGITILATNLKENMDDAFKRRIQFMVNFRLPSAQTRKNLWKSLLPEKAPREEDLDLDFFARQFELSGSQIKEILLQAAYIAAGQGKAVGNKQVKEALCLNYEKYGKRLTKEDFGYLA